jgi:dTDP-4-amino-4,6-dideoxygalactose transaminase
MTDFQGALGVVQMDRLAGIIERRRSLASTYDELLDPIPWLQRPTTPTGHHHIYQSYVTLLEESLDRDTIITGLRARGVESTIGTYACHSQPFYQQEYGYTPGDLPQSYRAFLHSLTLPLHSRMTDSDVETVVDALREVAS